MTAYDRLADLPWRIRTLRESRGWSVFDLAIEVGTCRATVARWEAGERTPGLESLCRLADAFEVTPDVLVMGR